VSARTEEEQKLEIARFVFRHERRFKKLRQQPEAYRNLERAEASWREQISGGVRLFLWQRDERKCVKCGSQERREFDHIIPVALSGSNTERNIQHCVKYVTGQRAQMYHSPGTMAGHAIDGSIMADGGTILQQQ
jgi:hypothetical protein